MITTQCKDSFIFFLCFHLVTSSFLLLSYYCFIYNFYLNKRHILLPQEGGTYYHTMLKSSGELGRVLLSLFFFSFFFFNNNISFIVCPADSCSRYNVQEKEWLHADSMAGTQITHVSTYHFAMSGNILLQMLSKVFWEKSFLSTSSKC